MRSALRQLSPRQRQVVTQRVQGKALKTVSADLGISIHTVKHHQGAAFRRLGVTCALELARVLLSA